MIIQRVACRKVIIISIIDDASFVKSDVNLYTAHALNHSHIDGVIDNFQSMPPATWIAKPSNLCFLIYLDSPWNGYANITSILLEQLTKNGPKWWQNMPILGVDKLNKASNHLPTYFLYRLIQSDDN